MDKRLEAQGKPTEGNSAREVGMYMQDGDLEQTIRAAVVNAQGEMINIGLTETITERLVGEFDRRTKQAVAQARVDEWQWWWDYTFGKPQSGKLGIERLREVDERGDKYKRDLAAIAKEGHSVQQD